MGVRIAVVGAGIMGVSSAYCIKKAFPGLDVVVITKEFSPHTTSDIAAGLWEPYLSGNTSEETLKRWCKATYGYITDLIKNDPTSGVAGLTKTHGFSLHLEETDEVPYWADIPYDFETLSKEDMQRFPDYIKSGHKFSSVIIECLKFIPWLSTKFVELGGRFIKREVKSLHELSGRFDIVVNCVGIEAKNLVNDDTVFPIRGQIAKVKAPWIKEFILLPEREGNRATYIIPNQDYVILGGTAYKNDWNSEVDSDDKKWILSSCEDIVPSLKYAEHLSDLVGFRPGRDTMRVEREDVVINTNGVSKTLKVIHNYGHGGCGLTVHRGCALDTLDLVTQCMAEVNALKSNL